MPKIPKACWQQLSEHLETESRRRKGIPGAVFGAAMGAARAMARSVEDEVSVGLVLSAAAVGLAYGAADLDQIGFD
jgi:hypothetical protein